MHRRYLLGWSVAQRFLLQSTRHPTRYAVETQPHQRWKETGQKEREGEREKDMKHKSQVERKEGRRKRRRLEGGWQADGKSTASFSKAFSSKSSDSVTVVSVLAWLLWERLEEPHRQTDKGSGGCEKHKQRTTKIVTVLLENNMIA